MMKRNAKRSSDSTAKRKKSGARLVPDPGVLPTRPKPKRGERIVFKVAGLPPHKDIRASVRNPSHPIHDRFIRLRKTATKAMAGRRWSNGAVRLDFTLYAPGLRPKSLTDYIGGICDTLDGSHGVHFTYLPIAFQDDCQVVSGTSVFKPSDRTYYELAVIFLD